MKGDDESERVCHTAWVQLSIRDSFSCQLMSKIINMSNNNLNIVSAIKLGIKFSFSRQIQVLMSFQLSNHDLNIYK